LLCALLGLGAGCANEAAAGRKWVHDLTFHGNRSFPSSAIANVIATQKTGWWPFARKQWMDPEALDIDLDRVVAFYAVHGYFDARVVGRQVRDRGNGSVDVVVTIDEGQPTRVQQVDLGGLSGLDA